MEDMEMLHGALRLVTINAGLKPDEKAFIICDPQNMKYAKVLAYAVASIGAEYSIGIMESRSTHGENPPEALAKAMLGADVIFAPTVFSLSHSDARIAANEAGKRFISMPDYSPEILKKGGALDADFLGIYTHTVKKLQDLLTVSKAIHVTTAAGTDITLDITGRIGNEVSGVCREAGTWGSPPNIEVNVSPIEDKTNGIVVVDGSIPMPQIGVLTSPVILHVENGHIVKFEGGKDADTLRTLLRCENNPHNRVVAEFGMGLNNKASLKGAMLEDEGCYGTCHFGIGHNADAGGENVADVHIDCVYKNPDVVIDGKTIMTAGSLAEEYLA